MIDEFVIDWKPDVGFYVLVGDDTISNYELWHMITSKDCILTHTAGNQLKFCIADSMGNLG